MALSENSYLPCPVLSCPVLSSRYGYVLCHCEHSLSADPTCSVRACHHACHCPQSISYGYAAPATGISGMIIKYPMTFPFDRHIYLHISYIGIRGPWSLQNTLTEYRCTDNYISHRVSVQISNAEYRVRNDNNFSHTYSTMRTI